MFKILTYSQSIRSIYFFNNSQKHVHAYACVGKPANPQTRNHMRVEGSIHKPASCCGFKFEHKRCLGHNLDTDENK